MRERVRRFGRFMTVATIKLPENNAGKYQPIVLINGYIEGVDAPFISNDDVASMPSITVAHVSMSFAV